MAKKRKQVKRRSASSRPGCEHVIVEPGINEVVVRGAGHAAFAWDSNKRADTPRFICTVCSAHTPLPGHAVRRVAR